jgi:hypothetical protein
MLIWIAVKDDEMKGVIDGLRQEWYKLSDEAALICCWCSGEKRRDLMVLDYWFDIGWSFRGVFVICDKDDCSLC